MIELYLMIYLKDKDEFDRGNFFAYRNAVESLSLSFSDLIKEIPELYHLILIFKRCAKFVNRGIIFCYKFRNFESCF